MISLLALRARLAEDWESSSLKLIAATLMLRPCIVGVMAICASTMLLACDALVTAYDEDE